MSLHHSVLRPLLLGILLTAGCVPRPAPSRIHGEQEAAPDGVPTAVGAPGSPVGPAGALSAATRSDPAPGNALRDFWRSCKSRDWKAAHAGLSTNSRSALTTKDLAQMVGEKAPTQGSSASWTAIFDPPEQVVGQPLPTAVTATGAEVEVHSAGGKAVVHLVQEDKGWKIDLLRSLSQPAP